MDFSKQTYLDVNEIKGSIIKSNISLPSNLLIVNEKGCNGLFLMKIKADKGKVLIVTEAETAVNLRVISDYTVIGGGFNKIFSSSFYSDSGEHTVKIIYDSSYSGYFKISVYAANVTRSDTLNLLSYDEVNNRVFLKDTDSVIYAFNNTLENPVITPYQGITQCSVLYNDGGINYPVSASLTAGVLTVTDRGVDTVISENVSSAVLLKPLLSSYHYHIYYIKDGYMKLIEKNAGGFSSEEGIGQDTAEVLISTGYKCFLYRTPQGRWHAIQEGVCEDIITINKITVDSIYIPSVKAGDTVDVYLRYNGKYVNKATGQPFTTADSLFFIDDKVYCLWNGGMLKF